MTDINDLLSGLAPYVRPLLQEVARSFQLSDLYIGIAFRYNSTSAIYFAEVVPALGEDALPPTDYAGDRYLLPRSLPLSQAVLDSADAHCRVPLQAPGHEEVEGELRKRWGNQLTELCLFRLPLVEARSVYPPDAVLYLGSRTEATEETSGAVARSATLISQVLRTALFFASGRPAGRHQRRLPDLAEELSRKLPRLQAYERHFQRAIDDRVNPTAWYTHRFPEAAAPTIRAEAGASEKVPPDIQTVLEAIRNASEIIVRKEPDGSFQHKAIRIVTITPRDPDGVPQAAAYDAVVKEVDREKAQKEQAGYQLAQLFFRDIGFALPPSPILWPISATKESEPRRFASVIPRVSGGTFTQYTRDRWHQRRPAYESTGDHFARIYRDLVAFANGLGQGPTVAPGSGELAHQCLYDSHFGDSGAARRRRGKTLAALRYFLGGIQNAPLLEMPNPPDRIEFCNPLWVFERICSNGVKADDRDFWVDCDLQPIPHVDFCHGDFHTGNILVRDDGSVTVLDYDYVGRDRKFLDIATLEASFLLSLAWSAHFEDETTWLATFPPLLSGLANQEEIGPVPRDILANRDSLDAWRVVQEGRRWVGREGSFGLYRALVASALFRLLASYHSLSEDRRRYNPGVISTAVCFLGALLRKLVRISPAELADPTPVMCLFQTPCSLEEARFDYGHEVTREYFKWLGRRFKLGTGDNSDVTELMGYASKKERGDAATAYRLGLRLLLKSKASGEMSEGLASALAALYRAEAECAEADERRSLLSAWADRYGLPLGRTRRPAEEPPSSDSLVMQAPIIEMTSRDADGFDVYGISHSGHFNAEGQAVGRNDDAFVIAKSSPSSFLAAVADGTGDSKDGARAARVALTALLGSWQSGAGLVGATVEASHALQRDNLIEGLDGACTLAAIEVEAATGAAHAVWVGDARVVLFHDGEEPKTSMVDLETRCVLGGEPLGDIVTSSGNRVTELMAASGVQELRVDRLRDFLLSSDGAVVNPAPESEVQALSALFEHGATSAAIGTAVLERALEAGRLRKVKRDNVTVLVGRRPAASSAGPGREREQREGHNAQ